MPWYGWLGVGVLAGPFVWFGVLLLVFAIMDWVNAGDSNNDGDDR